MQAAQDRGVIYHVRDQQQYESVICFQLALGQKRKQTIVTDSDSAPQLKFHDVIDTFIAYCAANKSRTKGINVIAT